MPPQTASFTSAKQPIFDIGAANEYSGDNTCHNPTEMAWVIQENKTVNPYAMCGLDCGGCEYREKMNCPTCHKAEGKMFRGKCSIAECVMAKELDNCSGCGEFPCEKLKAFAFDKDQGDNGKRIENLRSPL